MPQHDPIHLVAQHIAGLPVDPSLLDPDWQPVLARLTRARIEAIGLEQAVSQALGAMPGRRALLNRILDAIPPEFDYPSLAVLAADLPPIQWLWPNWIPRGMLSLLGASPGAGKSLVALDLARRIIHGLGFPDGTPVPKPGARVVYVDAEAVPQIQNERAQAWGMDRTRLHLMLPSDPYGMIDLGDEHQQDLLSNMCDRLQPELVVVDSLSAISVRGENNVEDVRALLGFLTNIAREYSLALLLVHHLRKRSAVPLADLVGPDDFRGSGHIIAMARSVLALSIVQDTAEPDRNGPRRLEVIKTNLCRYPAPLGLVLEPGDPRAPTLRYTDDAPAPYRDDTAADECADWLLQLLATAGEPMRTKDIIAAAKENGFSERTLYRTRKSLGDAIRNIGNRRSANSAWALPEHATEDDDD